jgi:hypothetical protein
LARFSRSLAAARSEFLASRSLLACACGRSKRRSPNIPRCQTDYFRKRRFAGVCRVRHYVLHRFKNSGVARYGPIRRC